MTTTPASDLPPFSGYVETTTHALRLIHAARQGCIPRITRRLNDAERRTMIKSGAIFVFSVEESGIKRWTDGLLWSPSRIVGNFLVYREINERANSRGGSRKPYPLESQQRGLSNSRRNSPDSPHVAFKGPGHLTQGDHATFKVGGLIKKTITVTVEGSDLHLVSYYTPEDIKSGKLKKPSSRPDIMSLHMPPHLFRSTNFRAPLKIDIGPDGKPRIVPDPEDNDLMRSEFKTEEESDYQLSSIHDWTSESLEAHTDRLQQACYGSPPPSYHSGRPDMSQASWSESPSPTNSHSLIRRRETSSHIDSNWSSSHSQSNRWRSEYITPPLRNANRHRERSGSNSGLQVSGYREILPQRTSWSHRDDSNGHGECHIRSPQLGSCHPQASGLSPAQNYLKPPQSLQTWQPTHDGGDNVGTYSSSHTSYEAPYSHTNYSSGLNYRYC